MTIKSDRWIRAQCERNSSVRMSAEDQERHRKEFGPDCFVPVYKNVALPPMIEPFEPGQVKLREVQDPDPRNFEATTQQRILSYGTSSYGYDARCASEFKIFTNVNSTIVDPKNFDARNYVEHTGDYCIIPPNSFALARTVEYFRIPRNVLVICLGKSTYARCFSGDTEVALANGTSVTFKDMVKRAAKGERFFGYGISRKLGVVVTELTAPRKINSGERLVRVHLDNDEYIDCTPDHLFLTRKGKYVEAQDLGYGDSLMPLYRYRTKQGREFVYDPVEKDRAISKNQQYKLTYWLADDYNLRSGQYSVEQGDTRHHVDHNKWNDYPTNITRTSRSQHQRHHALEFNAEYWTDRNRRKASRLIKEALRELRADPNRYAAFCEQQRAKAAAFWNSPEYAAARKVRSSKLCDKWEDPQYRRRQRKSRKAFYASAEGRQVLADRVMPKRKPLRKSVVLEALLTAESIKGAARIISRQGSMKITGGVIHRQYPNLVARLRREGILPNNHKVVRVERIKGRHDVYCLTSPETGNFALESGVFVKNCGIIVNVTPLEPEWEGYLTLEFSNTTPLPAKIYAGEGCAQLLFFESDEPCETSYKDRGGKYQGQVDQPVPPKV